MGEIDVRVLDGVDFTPCAGELLVLLGASGSGKSRLLNILGGLDVPSTGRIFFEGRELTDAADDELTQSRRHNVGFVFQFSNLIPSLTARENVALVTDIADDPLPADPRRRGSEFLRDAPAALRNRCHWPGHRRICGTRRPPKSAPPSGSCRGKTIAFDALLVSRATMFCAEARLLRRFAIGGSAKAVALSDTSLVLA